MFAADVGQHGGKSIIARRYFDLRATSRTAVGRREAAGATLSGDVRRTIPTRAVSGVFDFGFCADMDFNTEAGRTIRFSGRP
jgi:hypothetical protein